MAMLAIRRANGSLVSVCLLITPESLEVILVSRKWDKTRTFGAVRCVIVDEIHAFAGDDRGWHLLALLERIARLAGRAPQRIGLSATVGNPQELLEWLAGSTEGIRRVIAPEIGNFGSADVTIDHVGSLETRQSSFCGSIMARSGWSTAIAAQKSSRSDASCATWASTPIFRTVRLACRNAPKPKLRSRPVMTA